VFDIPTIRGTRAALDYDALNVYWDATLPEDGVDAVAIWLKSENQSAMAIAGVASSPNNFLRIDGPLTKNCNYEMVASCVPSGVHTIIKLVDATKIAIQGYHPSDFTSGDLIYIKDSAGIDSIRTIANVGTWTGHTQLTVSPGGLVASPTITGVNQTTNCFVITGVHASEYTAQEKVLLTVYGSTGNDGTYLVTDAIDDSASTRIYVAETIPSAVADGTIATGKLINATTAYTAAQSPIISIAIPNYETDDVAPTSPYGLAMKLDPENSRLLINWSRVAVDDDFLEYYVELSTIGNFAISGIAATYFLITGDQRTYFPAGITITSYGGTNNNREYLVLSSSLDAGNTRVYVDGTLNTAVADGALSSELAWLLLDKTKQTSLISYFPFVYGTGTYYLRVRATDRNGNKSAPSGCASTFQWNNPHLIAAEMPAWATYTESYYTTFQGGYMRYWKITINDNGRQYPYFRYYGIKGIQRPWTNAPASYLTGAETETFARDQTNQMQIDGSEMPNLKIRTVAQSAVDPLLNYIDVNGVLLSYFATGDIIRISGSTGNDGTYTVHASAMVGGGTQTRIYLVTGGTGLPDGTVDGQVDWATFILPFVEDWFGNVEDCPSTAILTIPSTSTDP
jgi:hypothetical protein